MWSGYSAALSATATAGRRSALASTSATTTGPACRHWSDSRPSAVRAQTALSSIVPNLLGRVAFRGEEQVRFDVPTGGGEHARREADHAPQVTVVEQFPLCLPEGGFGGAEQYPLVQYHAAAAARL